MAQFSYHVDGRVYILECVKTGSDSSTAKRSNTGLWSANHGSKESISIRQLSFPKNTYFELTIPKNCYHRFVLRIHKMQFSLTY